MRRRAAAARRKRELQPSATAVAANEHDRRAAGGVGRSGTEATNPAFYYVRSPTRRRVSVRACPASRRTWEATMKEIIDQFMQFLQNGIAAIFRFVQLIWTWSAEQITRLMQTPWETWPLWKQVLLAVVIVAVAYALFVAAMRVWVASVRVLGAFASLLAALVYTLPPILIAGAVALGGLWLINNFNPASLPTIAVFDRSDTGTAKKSSDRASAPSRETTGSAQ
jgi:hypothetical protein